MKKLIIILFAASLGGCASQFGTRLCPAPVVVHRAVVATGPTPAPVPAVAPTPEPVPAPRVTLRQRLKASFKKHHIIH